MKNNKFFLLIFFYASIFYYPNSAFSQIPSPNRWNQWLDSAYKLTWHSSQDINTWISKNEKIFFKESLLTYVKNREKYISPDQNKIQSRSFPDRFYLRLSIAEMLLYLQTKNMAHLEKAARIMRIKRLQSKIELPEIAFWFHYIDAHLKMEKSDAKGFSNCTYKMWINTILKLEAAHYDLGTSGLNTQLPGFYQSLPFLYRNIANLIIQRAIIEKRLTHLDALGSLIWNLSHRMPPNKGYGLWIKQIVDRITGTKSDNFRLAYTVLLLDAENQKRATENLIDSSVDIKIIENNIIKAYENYEFLYKTARYQMGQIVLLTQRLNLTSFILSRLYQTSEQRKRLEKVTFLQAKENLAWHESMNILSMALTCYDNSAQKDLKTVEWRDRGFLDQQAYTTVMRELWQAIMSLCLENGFYYRERIDSESGDTFLTFVPLVENSIKTYLDFFEKYVSRGNLDIVPNNAYYGAVEASQLLSEVYFMSIPWQKDVHHDEKGFYYWLQSVEIFPFDVNSYYLMAHQLSRLGRLDLYMKYLKTLTKKIKHSYVIDNYKTKKNSKYLGRSLGQLQRLIPKVIVLAPSITVIKNGNAKIPKTVVQNLERARKEIENKAGGFNQGSNDEKQIIGTIRLMHAMDSKKRIKHNDFNKIEHSLSETIRLLNRYEKRYLKSTPHTVEDIFLISHSASHVLPNQLKKIIQGLDQFDNEMKIQYKLPNYKGIREALVLETDHPYHEFIREFYHENSRRNLNYLNLLKKK